MKELLRRMLFVTWVVAMLLFLAWYGTFLARQQQERAEYIKKTEQRLDEVEKRAQEVCEQAVALCHQVGAQGCGECPK